MGSKRSSLQSSLSFPRRLLEGALLSQGSEETDPRFTFQHADEQPCSSDHPSQLIPRWRLCYGLCRSGRSELSFPELDRHALVPC